MVDHLRLLTSMNLVTAVSLPIISDALFATVLLFLCLSARYDIILLPIHCYITLHQRPFCLLLEIQSQAAARAYRVGSRTDFVLPGGWHPLIDWAEKEPEPDPEEMAKVRFVYCSLSLSISMLISSLCVSFWALYVFQAKVAFIGNLPTNSDEDFLRELFEPFGKVDKVIKNFLLPLILIMNMRF